MKASNISLLKLSQVSSRHFLRRSAQLEKRCFVTILNPSAPKVKRLQRSPGFEAQTFESEKISILRKALKEANLGQSSVESPNRYEEVTSIKGTVTKDVEDVEKVTEKVTGQDPVVEKEIIENLPKPEENEPVALEDAQITKDDESPKETPSSPVESIQEENYTQSVKVELDKLDIDPKIKSLDQEKKKKLTKKGRKSTNATATISTDDTEEEDSSSSDSDSSSSSSSSSSSDSGSEVENDEDMSRSRLTQVHFDLKLTLILQCLQFQEMFLDLAKLSHVKPHKPMIRFRKGKGPLVKPDQVKREAELDINIQESSPTVLEWWEKPAKYYPEALDETEIEQINSGGASRLYQ